MKKSKKQNLHASDIGIDKVRILQVVGTLNRGGAETFLINIYKTIDRRKFKFYFLCYGDEEYDYQKEVESLGGIILRIPEVKQTGILRQIIIIKKLIIENNIQIVQAHTQYNSVFSLIAAKIAGIDKRIMHVHTTLYEVHVSNFKKIYYYVSKIIINKFANIKLACGGDAGKVLYGRHHFVVIKNGIIIDNYIYNPNQRKKLRDKLGIKKSECVIGHVGRFEDVKNHSFLLDIFYEYLKLNNAAKLLLVGDGKKRQEIENKADELGIGNRLVMTGLVNNVNELYSVMDVMVFPSKYEGMPLTLIEAQANGLHCLVSDAVDKHIAISDSVIFYPLSKSAQDWSGQLSAMSITRKNNIYSIKKSGYSAQDTSDLVAGIYLNENMLHDYSEKIL